ncbi:MAG TPA: OsmC family protein [Anaerolineaceae bacterium]|jgi:putative redox protein|nr:OsmC family protein [Longilinea sp.]HNR46391.1 OsmC family protein [Anaerolineaceae bacterium]HNS37891.1 OsmC family protein [Anaerolineaceae bacterium]HOD05508.1 OsmC family protein [Anaerolineaceae bacterium]HOG80431.1 OsmC family protein [Anaerolineaceae bacterium]
MGAKVTWKSGFSFTATADSGFELPLGVSSEAGGADDGFRPMELLLVGLAGCTAMDVISILEKKRQQVTAFEVKTQGQRAADHPRIFTDIEIEYIVTGHNIDPAAVQRAVELSESKYCSAQAMLSKAARITNKITILEA